MLRGAVSPGGVVQQLLQQHQRLPMNDADSCLAALSSPSAGFNAYTGNSAGVVGSGEVYKDPRDKWTKRWDPSLPRKFSFSSETVAVENDWDVCVECAACVCAVRSRRTPSPVTPRRAWPSRSASGSSLRGRRSPTRSKLPESWWSWRTSSTPSSEPEPFTSPAATLRSSQTGSRASVSVPSVSSRFSVSLFLLNHKVTGPFISWRSFLVAIGETFTA